MAELTVVALSKKIHNRVEAAARKKLIHRLGEAGRHFFKAREHGGPVSRQVPNVLVTEPDKWSQGSCTTSWTWEVICYTKIKGKAQIWLRYELAGWGADKASVELILENGTVVPVLVAHKNTSSKAVTVAELASDGWFYGVYVPGNWERYLDGPKLEKVAFGRQNAEDHQRLRLSKAEKKRRLLEPVSPQLQQEVFANYGIK